MGEYAYDFTGENVHDGNAHNPHDPSRMTGGSSSGSGGSVAGGLVPLSLGSDTNGSIRVPSSFCGLFGLKPTYGRLTRARSYPFVSSFDHLGPLTRSPFSRPRARAYDAMQGPDAEDPVCVDRPVEPTTAALQRGTQGLRIAVAGGYFRKGDFPAEAATAVERIAAALGATREIEIPEAPRALGRLHHHGRRRREPASRPRAHARQRFRAGGARPADRRRDDPGEPGQPRAEIPPLVSRARARAVRGGGRDPGAGDAVHGAACIGQQTFVIDGTELPVRPNIGIFTQPISFIGLPVVAVPVPLMPMPIGVQIIAAPWREDIALRIAYALEQYGRRDAAPRPAL